MLKFARVFQFPSAIALVVGAAHLQACGGSQSAEPVAPAPAAPPAVTAPSAPASPTPTAAAAPPAAAEAAPPPAADAAPKHNLAHHGGMIATLIQSLNSIELRADQKAPVANIEADLDKLGEQQESAAAKLAADLADGVAAGKIDHAKTDADIKELAKAIEAAKAGVQDATKRLHETLDPAQRKALADAMHTAREANAEHAGGADNRADALGLSPKQQDEIKAKLEARAKIDQASMKPKAAAMEKRAKTIGDAFSSDKFDAKKAGIGDGDADLAKQAATADIGATEAVLAVLSPEQRTKLAALVREHRITAGHLDPAAPQRFSPFLCCVFRTACCF